MSNQREIQRRQIVGALSDRIILAYKEGGSVKFLARATPLLEPLILGYLSSFSSHRLKQEIDIDLIQRACKFLDTNLISQNFTAKLR